MANMLTKQDVKFVENFVKTGNGTKAVQEAFDIEDPNYAGVKANRLLRKDKIQKGIVELLPDDILSEKHKELFNQIKIEYFVFPKQMEDEEIIEHVNSVGIKVLNIRPSDKGKLAFYAIPDANAVKNALDLAYKIKGSYAPDRSINVNVEVESNPQLAKEFDEWRKQHIKES